MDYTSFKELFILVGITSMFLTSIFNYNIEYYLMLISFLIFINCLFYFILIKIIEYLRGDI
jgi:hypothetical protein